MPNNRRVWKSVNEIFTRLSYVSPQLRKYIRTKKFRRSYMYDGKTLLLIFTDIKFTDIVQFVLYCRP